jgi:hypothetical protein
MKRNVFGIFSVVMMACSIAYSKNHNLTISSSQSISLKQTDWVQGSGSFIPNTTPINIFSHKKKKEFQILYEDLYIPRSSLKERLPKECLSLAEFEKDTEACKFLGTASPNSYAINFISINNLSAKNIVKVRTVYIVGKKEDVEKLSQQIKTSAKDGKVKR